MGYGVIAIADKQIRLVEMGVLQLARFKDHGKRLHFIFEKVSALVQTHQPEAVALEAPFFGKNVQSMLKLGRAQGVAIAAAMAHGSSTVEYAPRKVKQVVAGNGNASKEQVWKMLQHILRFTQDTRYLDASDAVAVALCHHYQVSGPLKAGTGIKTGTKKPGSWKHFIDAHPDRIKHTRP